jgi:hypothetical protein
VVFGYRYYGTRRTTDLPGWTKYATYVEFLWNEHVKFKMKERCSAVCVNFIL